MSKKRIPFLQRPIPDPIPYWALANDTPFPCPCGHPMEDSIIAYQGEDGFVRLYHPHCYAYYSEFRDEDDV